MRRKAGTVEAVDDLTGLAEKKFDYAIVVDWRPNIRFDLLGKYAQNPNVRKAGKESIIIADQKLGAFVIDQNMEIVKQLDQTPSTVHSEWRPDRKCAERKTAGCDELYIMLLARFFLQTWEVENGNIVEFWLWNLE